MAPTSSTYHSHISGVESSVDKYHQAKAVGKLRYVVWILRGAVKYYFVDFVRKGGGGTSQIRNPLFAKKICNGGRGVPPQSVTHFLDQNQVFLSKKHNF